MKLIELRFLNLPRSPRRFLILIRDILLRLYASYKRTYKGKKPKWVLMYLLSRFYLVRCFVKRYFKRPRSAFDPNQHSLFTTLDFESARKALDQQGCYLGLQLPPDYVQEILEFAETHEAIANFDHRLRFIPAKKDQYESMIDEKIGVATLLNVQRCAAIRKLENDPRLRELAASHLDTEPFVSSRLWWSYPGQISQFLRFQLSQEVFHYDTIDYNSLKFFFYITPVDESNGPHMCVLNSHRHKKLHYLLTFFIGRYEWQILQDYDSEEIVTICGEAGYGFIEDPFCFHRASFVQHKPRLMLELSYTQTPLL